MAKLMISGYAVTFGKDCNGLTYFPKSFKNTISRSLLDAIPMLYGHDSAKIIGSWKCIEVDKKGLFVEGEIDGRSLVSRMAIDQVIAGELHSMSISVSILNRWIKRGKVKDLNLIEISLTSNPMDDEALIERKWIEL